LEDTRTRGDMIQVFKLMQGIQQMGWIIRTFLIWQTAAELEDIGTN